MYQKAKSTDPFDHASAFESLPSSPICVVRPYFSTRGVLSGSYLSTTGPFNSFNYLVYSIRPRLLCCARTGTSLRAPTHDQTHLILRLLIRSSLHVAAPAPVSMAFVGVSALAGACCIARQHDRSPGTRAASLLSQTHAITSATFYDSCSLPNHRLQSEIPHDLSIAKPVTHELHILGQGLIGRGGPVHILPFMCPL